jgi:hypothetical protein
MAKGNGIESKGKTKGKNLGDTGPTVAEFTGKGGNSGKSNADMLKYGRNMAKVVNQRSSGRGR